MKDQLLIFEKIHNHWLKVIKKEQITTNAQVQAKLDSQDQFLVKIVVAFSGYLYNKVLMF